MTHYKGARYHGGDLVFGESHKHVKPSNHKSREADAKDNDTHDVKHVSRYAKRPSRTVGNDTHNGKNAANSIGDEPILQLLALAQGSGPPQRHERQYAPNQNECSIIYNAQS